MNTSSKIGYWYFTVETVSFETGHSEYKFLEQNIWAASQRFAIIDGAFVVQLRVSKVNSGTGMDWIIGFTYLNAHWNLEADFREGKVSVKSNSYSWERYFGIVNEKSFDVLMFHVNNTVYSVFKLPKSLYTYI